MYIALAEYQKAEQCYLEALEIRRRTVGQKHHSYMKNVNTLIRIYEKMGNTEKATQLRSQI